MSEEIVLWFEHLDDSGKNSVGKMGASIGEMKDQNLPVPAGFLLTDNAYEKFLNKTGIGDEIKEILEGLNSEDSNVSDISDKIRKLIIETDMPPSLEDEIKESYIDLCDKVREIDLPVSLRTSAMNGYMPGSSFSSHQESFLGVTGEENVLKKVKECWASLFTTQAIHYRERKGHGHDVSVSVSIQEMIDSEKGGVFFTSHPSLSENGKMVIEANWGLSETVVTGSVTPDTYIVDRNVDEIEDITIGSKEEFLRFESEDKKVDRVQASEKEREDRVLNNDEILQLSELAEKVEEVYGEPRDVEWVFDGQEFYLLQSRPVTVFETEEVEDEEGLPGKGVGIFSGVSSGSVSKLENVEGKNLEGDILVASTLDSQDFDIAKNASGLVVGEVSNRDKLKEVSEEFEIPTVTDVGELVNNLEENMVITVDGTSGEVLEGERMKEEEEKDKITSKKEYKPVSTVTDVMVNITFPETVGSFSENFSDGVGILKSEQMVLNLENSPRELLESGDDEILLKQLQKGLRTVLNVFSDKPIRYRTLKLKSSELENINGEDENEENPSLGLYGIRKFVNPENPVEQEVLKTELRALKSMIDEGFENIGVMIPMVQSPKELRRFKMISREVGLEPHEDFEVGIVVETPASAIIIEEFLKEKLDFVSVDLSSLTQFTLAAEKGNDELSNVYNENHSAVDKLLRKIGEKCDADNVDVGIIGGFDSLGEIVDNLVKYGFSSISTDVNSVERIRNKVDKSERKVILETAREMINQ